MSELTAYDEAVEEGELRGKLISCHNILLRQGRKKFGPPDEAIEAVVKTIQDLEHLDRLVDALWTTNSWPELLATP